MKFTFNILLLLAFVVFALATKQQQPLKPYIVSYPKHTPSRFLEDAKKAVLHAGGVITHEYNSITGFACKTSKTVLESIEIMASGHKILIEEDQTISINV
ncbi:hypothetical protein CLAFUW4_03347 [Fulvia fulva]|uniref:Inhibitor I9 domain-containing protein n=1 Tax=Passalora fulva TaxID=5499 RepID=A0A9Q8P531_PASFU|nr:uncharacterized protein CLAFUR5_03327 [Fulvia fulva]KAK4631902.1 hypothetical protein CLAFUR4_03336 [Fulvia fulva]KAK4633872.1 hypothetical protein CLAFUR0_03341 [Fulvia fulva]UJO13710.1 hypothetical protein CLAFUR5_03327 [Fulvia fulva]WPV11299.1 hypothetical protein CLAFUW4_03347 [Fulvia fulva]WPV26255.1 hypothetical protein CLAFUW7_03339 [Fulvia fulva]